MSDSHRQIAPPVRHTKVSHIDSIGPTKSRFERVKGPLPGGSRFSAAGLAGAGIIMRLISAIFSLFAMLLGSLGIAGKDGKPSALSELLAKAGEALNFKKEAAAPPPPSLESQMSQHGSRIANLEDRLLTPLTGVPISPARKLPQGL